MFDDTFSRCIGIGEISLVFLVTCTYGKRRDRGQASLEESARIIIYRQVGFLSPAFHVVGHSVFVLELRQAKGFIKHQAGRKGYLTDIRIAFLRCNQDNAISRLATIQGGCRRALQDTDTFNVFGIQIRDTVTAITVSGIGSTANSGKSLFIGRIKNRNTVYDIQRLVVTYHRADATHQDFRRTTQAGSSLVYLYPRYFSGKRINHIRVFHPFQFLAINLFDGIGQRGFFSFYTQGGYDNIVEK